MREEYRKIDVKTAAERLQMPETIIENLIVKTLNGDLMQEAEQAFTDGDLKKAELKMHTIKGSCATVGLTGISELASEIEFKIKENNYLDFDLLSIMRDVWNELKKTR